MSVRFAWALLLPSFVASSARAEPAAVAPPEVVSCEAGLEESFNDATLRSYLLEIGPNPPETSRYALLSRYENLRTSSFSVGLLGRRRTSGHWKRAGDRFVFRSPFFTLSVAVAAVPGGGDGNAALLVAGRKVPARCGFGRKPPLTPGIAFLRSSAFAERWKQARDALSDDYALYYGRLTAKRAGQRTHVEVELRKQRTESCPRRRESGVPGVLYARIDGELVGGAAQPFAVERASSSVLAPSPPIPAPSAEWIAERVAERYRAAPSLELEYSADVGLPSVFYHRSQRGVLRVLPGALSLRHENGTHWVARAGSWRGFAPASPDSQDVAVESHLPYGLALGFLAGTLGERYTLRRVREEERCTDAFVLAGTPRRTDAPRLFVSVDPKTFRVRSVHVAALHVELRMRFVRERTGVRWPAREFELEESSGARALGASEAFPAGSRGD